MPHPSIISCSSLGHNGRLGNQLFQVASVLGLAEKHGAHASFPPWKYEQYFEPLLPHGQMQTNQVKEQYFHHYDWGLTASCDVFGYLQSEKYFGSQKLKLKESWVRKQKAKLPGLFDRQTICIHVRRGDMAGNPNYYQIPPTFYFDALLTHFPNWRDYNLLFISDDIEYCRVHFQCLTNATFSSGNTDIGDMALASACDHFIISNSTFGWWCAWLGEKPHSKIIHSGYLFEGRLAKNDDSDYRPARWTVHKKQEYKLDLRDITFTIPVFYDHESRKKNLDLILCLLQRFAISNFVVMEQGGESFKYISKFADYIHFPAREFHRTKMLNDMARAARTPYVANWDCDVIVPPVQLYMAVEELRAGGDMVFPYDGRFARMPRDWFDPIEKAVDIGVVGNHVFKGMEPDHNSVGGAVLFNRESFICGGMENEHFISFGPEDCERHDRFKTLGYDVRRARGVLYHMNHHVGVNSSPKNPHFKNNHVELERIRKMDADTLSRYIDTWGWVR